MYGKFQLTKEAAENLVTSMSMFEEHDSKQYVKFNGIDIDVSTSPRRITMLHEDTPVAKMDLIAPNHIRIRGFDARMSFDVSPKKKKLKSLETFNAEGRECYYAFVYQGGEPIPNGIECPKCKGELVDSSPSCTLTSNPPQKYVHCPQCGYKGYRVA
jgi:hypothetical protein